MRSRDLLLTFFIEVRPGRDSAEVTRSRDSAEVTRSRRGSVKRARPTQGGRGSELEELKARRDSAEVTRSRRGLLTLFISLFNRDLLGQVFPSHWAGLDLLASYAEIPSLGPLEGDRSIDPSR